MAAGAFTPELAGTLAFLKAAEALKSTLRSGHTSQGRRESVAEHTWRVVLMAVVLADELPDVDLIRLVRMLLIHDLGEAISGDVPATEQATFGGKPHDERADFITLIAPLPAARRAEFLALWDEYEAAQTLEARVAKGLDKLETILQHNQGLNPPDFDYAFNLTYGACHTNGHPLLATLRSVLDNETRARAAEQG